jgi:solute carrier family 25 protein 34/35
VSIFFRFFSSPLNPHSLCRSRAAMENFFFGGFAAALSICILNPVDVVKSRMQFQGELGGRVAYSGIVDAFRKIAAAEGLRGLYRGLAPAICFQAMGNSFRFGVYYAGRIWYGVDSDSHLDPRVSFQLALVAGAAGGVAACPFFAIKTCMQVQSAASDLAVGTQHGYRSTRHALRSIVQERGVRGLWRGLDALMPRVLALVSVQLTTYDHVKSRLRRAGWANGTPTHFVSSAVASFCATIAMQPFDLVAARLMNQPSTEGGRPALYTGPLDCFRKIVATEGPLALTKGGLSNYCRVGPQYILTFVFFERMKLMYAAHWARPPASPTEGVRKTIT